MRVFTVLRALIMLQKLRGALELWDTMFYVSNESRNSTLLFFLFAGAHHSMGLVGKVTCHNNQCKKFSFPPQHWVINSINKALCGCYADN